MGAESKKLEAETKDEIQDIMNEIESLKQNIAEAPKQAKLQPVPPASPPRVSPPPAPPQLAAAMPVAETVPEVSAEEISEIEKEVQDVMMSAESGDTEDSTSHLTLVTSESSGENEQRGDAMTEQHSSEEMFTQDEMGPEGALASSDGAFTSTEGALTMTLSGKMTLKLKYEFEDLAVTIGFQDHVLKVQLSDGTVFNIPVRRASGFRKAA